MFKKDILKLAFIMSLKIKWFLYIKVSDFRG